jgi:hypothetical protein
MALLHSLSKPVVRGEVDLFSIPPTDTTCEYSMYAEYQPVVNIQDCSSKIDFKISSNGLHYLDLSDCFLAVRVKVINKNGNNLTTDSKVAPTNCFLHSLFSQLDVSFNSQVVSTSNNAYPYRALIETLLSYGTDYTNSQGECFLYYPDENTALDSTNSGVKKRQEYIKLSKELEMIDKLRFDIGTQQRYILNDITVNITLTRSPDEFALLGVSTEEAKIKFIRASLFVRKQILFPSIVLAHQRLLEKGEVARYPHKRTDVKYFTIPQGNASAVEENLFSGTLPSRLILFFVASSSFVGNISKNPFIFSHYNVTKIGLTVNNLDMPIHPIQMDFDNDNYLLPYYMLFTSTGIAGQDSGIRISREAYKSVYTLFSFDIVQATNSSSFLNLDKSGNIKLDIQFGKPLPEAVHCVVYSEHQALLEIDKYRQTIITQ